MTMSTACGSSCTACSGPACGPTTSTSATPSRAPSTCARRSRRASRSSRDFAATPPATRARPSSSTGPAAPARSRSPPRRWSDATAATCCCATTPARSAAIRTRSRPRPRRSPPASGEQVRVGLCYDLRDAYRAAGYGDEETAEFDAPDTLDAIEGALRKLGHETERIGHVGALAGRLVEGRRWDLVFNTAEGLRGVGREAQVPALLEAFDQVYTFSDPLVSALTLHKAMAKRVLRDLGLPTADFRVVETGADAKDVDLPFPLFVK